MAHLLVDVCRGRGCAGGAAEAGAGVGELAGMSEIE